MVDGYKILKAKSTEELVILVRDSRNREIIGSPFVFEKSICQAVIFREYPKDVDENRSLNYGR